MADYLKLATDQLQALPDWVVSICLFCLALIVGIAVFEGIYRFLARVTESDLTVWHSIVRRSRRTLRLAIIAITLAFAASLAPLTNGQEVVVRHVLIIVTIVIAGWIAHLTLELWIYMYLRKYQLNTEDNLFARKHVTQTRILQRIANFLIVVISTAWALMTFDPVRQYGVSLLASAGAAGLVAGLALQPVLKNLFAGIQLAITQPIRIDDALLVEGEWGRVEEITSTYVVIKIWDWRRLVLPLSYFIEHPFQNWTRETASLIGTVFIYTDFTMPVHVVREKVQEIASGSKLWDRQVMDVAVTDFRERVMEIRILVSARNSGDTFTLRCVVREQLIAFLQENYRQCLPLTRADIDRGSHMNICSPANDMPSA